MRFPPIRIRGDGDNAERIDRRVIGVTCRTDRLEIDGAVDPVPGIEITGIGPQVRIVDQAPSAASVQHVIDTIEPHQRGEQKPVRGRHRRSAEITATPQSDFERIQGFKNLGHRLVISGLGFGKTGPVHPVRETRMDALHEPRRLRIGMDSTKLKIEASGWRTQSVNGFENPQGLIADDTLLPAVPQNRNGRAARIAGMAARIELVQVPDGHVGPGNRPVPPSVHRIPFDARSMRRGQRDPVGPAFQQPGDDNPV